MNLRRFLSLALAFVFLAAVPLSFALISVGPLSKEKAKELGVTMNWRTNGDHGYMVWLEFTPDSPLREFTYVELQISDEKGKHRLSAHLKPRKVVYQQAENVKTVPFSAQLDQLGSCSFMVVNYKDRGGVGYTMNVADYLDLKEPPRPPGPKK